MEESRPPLEELPETHRSRLDRLGSLFKRKQRLPEAPEDPPPLLVGELAAFAEATPQPDNEVEVALEAVPELEPEEVRQKLEEVYEAAEIETVAEDEPAREAPIELDYEKRAEIKQEPVPTDQERSLADSIGNVLAELKEKTAAAHAAFSQTLPKPSGFTMPNLPLPATFTALPAMYQRAVVAGFGGAVLMLLLVALWF